MNTLKWSHIIALALPLLAMVGLPHSALALTCHHAHTPTQKASVLEVLQIQNFWKFLKGSAASTEDFQLHFHVINESESSYHRLAKDQPLTSTFIQVPLSAMDKIYMDSISHKELFEQVYLGYGKSVQPEIIQHISEVEKIIAKGHQTFLMVYGPQRKLLGLQRIFFVKDERGRQSKLPLQVSFGLRGSKSKVVDDSAVRAENSIEVGGFYIHPDLKGESRMRVQALLNLALLSNLQSIQGPAYFYGHTSTKAHNSLYKKMFDLDVVETVQTPTQKIDEYVLATSVDRAKARISEQLQEVLRKIDVDF